MTNSNWILNIADNQGNSIVAGIPLVTGVDLLGQYEYLGIGGSLYCYTDSDPTAIPLYSNLGLQSHVYFSVPPVPTMYEVPLTPQAQVFFITLNNVQYQMTLQYCSAVPFAPFTTPRPPPPPPPPPT